MDTKLPKKLFLLGSPGSKFDIVTEILEKVVVDSGNKCVTVKNYQPDEFLPSIDEKFSQDWIICIYQKDSPGLQSWLESGEKKITQEKMKSIIKTNNKHILSFVMKHYLKLERFTPYWIERNFDQKVDFDCSQSEDIFVTIYQPKLFKQVD